MRRSFLIFLLAFIFFNFENARSETRAPKSSGIIGEIVSLKKVNGVHRLIGWACEPKLNGAINVLISLHSSPLSSNDVHPGYITLADQQVDAALSEKVVSTCGDSKHGFNMTIGSYRFAKYPGAFIFANGLSQLKAINAKLTNSGSYRVPLLPLEKLVFNQNRPVMDAHFLENNFCGFGSYSNCPRRRYPDGMNISGMQLREQREGVRWGFSNSVQELSDWIDNSQPALEQFAFQRTDGTLLSNPPSMMSTSKSALQENIFNFILNNDSDGVINSSGSRSSNGMFNISSKTDYFPFQSDNSNIRVLVEVLPKKVIKIPDISFSIGDKIKINGKDMNLAAITPSILVGTAMQFYDIASRQNFYLSVPLLDYGRVRSGEGITGDLYSGLPMVMNPLLTNAKTGYIQPLTGSSPTLSAAQEGYASFGFQLSSERFSKMIADINLFIDGYNRKNPKTPRAKLSTDIKNFRILSAGAGGEMGSPEACPQYFSNGNANFHCSAIMGYSIKNFSLSSDK